MGNDAELLFLLNSLSNNGIIKLMWSSFLKGRRILFKEPGKVGILLFPSLQTEQLDHFQKTKGKKVNSLSFESELLPTLNSQSWGFWHLP